MELDQVRAGAAETKEGEEVNCNICGWSGKKFREGPRGEKFCPGCGSRSRHRHMRQAFLQSAKDPVSRVLMVGASNAEVLIYSNEKFTKIVRISGVNPKHGRIMDLADLKFQANSFSVVHACHVLEHVEKIREAMHEVYRVLKPGGMAVFCVPIPRRPKSVMRSKPDKQGHWWLIGENWPGVYELAGFSVESHAGTKCPSALGVKPDNTVHICRK